MGRGKFKGRGRGGGGRGGGRGGNLRAGGQPRKSYPDIVKKHEKLENYYNILIDLSDEDRIEFWEALRRELPNSFRFCGSKGHALAVKRLLEERYAPEISKIERYDGETVEPPKPVIWYPDQLAYSMNTSKQVIRKFPPFAAFQKYLVSETSVGNISRQELVSMIPPLLMDVKPSHTVLDMCAAPGSKASQLLEMIHVGEEARIRKVLESFGEAQPNSKAEEDVDMDEETGDYGRATGLLIANDADYKRSHMLVHQLKRLSSPNLLVTNHDATIYPAIRLPRTKENPDKGHYLKFDRILADVPCSGDGTLRKNFNLWKDWQPGSALGLHVTQLRILLRALQMLKVGGRVVYSTCSMNPVENESVIAAAIERCGGPDKVHIVDCSDRLPGLKRTPGMKNWKVMDKGGRIWNSWKEVKDYAAGTESGALPGKVIESMFPKEQSSDGAEVPLDRCMRVYAHQQDTGGFFITVLEKKTDLKIAPEQANPNNEAKQEAKTSNGNSGANGDASNLTDGLMEKLAEEKAKIDVQVEEAKAAVGEPTDELPTSAGTKRPREDDSEGQPLSSKKPKSEDETAPVVNDSEMVDSTPAVTEISEKATPSAVGPADGQKKAKGPSGAYEEPFKYLPPSHPVIENIIDFYNLSPRFPRDRYMVRNALGEPAKAIYYTSSLLRDILIENEGRGIKCVHGGVKMFMKQDAPSAEVCRWRIQSEGMPIIQGYVGPERVIKLTNKETFRKLLKEMFPRFAEKEWENLNEIGERARDIGMGCCVLKVEPDGSDPDFSERTVLPLWKSFQSLNLMLPKEDRAAMLLRIFNDTSPVINTTLKQTKERENAALENAQVEDKASNDAELAAAEDAPSPEEANDVKMEEAGGESLKEEEVDADAGLAKQENSDAEGAAAV